MINAILKLLNFRPKKKVRQRRAKPSQNQIKLHHQGDHHHLKELYDEINLEYFEGKLELPITWSGVRSSMPRTRVLFGTYDQQNKLIKIHRRLDQAHIPRYFVAFVIYHEILHHVLPPIQKRNQKRKIHHCAFKEKEKQFKDYALVEAFRKQMKSSWFKR